MENKAVQISRLVIRVSWIQGTYRFHRSRSTHRLHFSSSSAPSSRASTAIAGYADRWNLFRYRINCFDIVNGVPVK